MAMTAVEAAQLHDEQTVLFRHGATQTMAAGRPEAAAFSYWIACQCAIVAGLIRWRHSLGSPCASFRTALEVGQEAKRAGIPPHHGSDYAALRFIQILISAPAAAVGYPALGWPPPERSSVLVPQLDVGLAQYLEGGAPPDCWTAVLKRVSRRHMPLRRTFEAYAAIIDAARGSRTDLVAESTRLFRRRGDGWDTLNGGGLANKDVTDFRLAAILKASGASETERAAAGPHVWPSDEWGAA